MADTIADNEVSGDDWSDVNTLTSIAAGTEIQITNVNFDASMVQ